MVAREGNSESKMTVEKREKGHRRCEYELTDLISHALQTPGCGRLVDDALQRSQKI
jgi:hypothetical protein